MIDQEIARQAAEQANELFRQWVPELWLSLFIDSYDDIEECRAALPAGLPGREAFTEVERKSLAWVADEIGRDDDWINSIGRETDALIAKAIRAALAQSPVQTAQEDGK